MKTYKSEFLRTISERGFIHQCTDDTALDNILNKVYYGDPYNENIIVKRITTEKDLKSMKLSDNP